jgi:hypothetical protein
MEQVANITTLVSSTDGTVYLRTQHGNTAAEIAESLKPYVGRTMSCELPNNYGHYRRCLAVLLGVTGDDVTVRVPRYDYETTISAMDAFGSNCTTIEPEKKGN